VDPLTTATYMSRVTNVPRFAGTTLLRATPVA
jgi:hypothetical protein